MNAPSTLLAVFAWLVILFLLLRTYRNQEVKPKAWKNVNTIPGWIIFFFD